MARIQVLRRCIVIKSDCSFNALNDIANSPSDKQKTKKDDQPLTLDRTSLKRFKTDNAITPELGGRLKAHKTDYPLREISNAVGPPGHELAKTLNKVFSPYVGNTKSFLRSGEHFIQILHTGSFDKGMRVSLDAIALYPNIIVDVAVEILEQKLTNDRNLSTRNNLSKQELLRLRKLCVIDPAFHVN